MILNNFPTDSDQHVPRKTGELLKRDLSEERGYHVDLLQVLRQLSAGALTPALQSAIAELHQRRQSITSLKVEILDRHAAERGRSGRDPTLSEIAYDFDATTQFDVQTQTQDVRRLIIQTRIAADRLGSRLSLMHQCLEEILTGKPSTKTTSYNREGRLQSLPSNRSLLTRRG